MEVSQVKLKWNNHQCVFRHYLQEYFNQPRFSDAMIACESRIFMVHRIILSTCSNYFEDIFQNAPNDNTRPVIILNDTTVECVEWLLAYMYCGEVTVPKESLSVLFKLAEQLKVKGLSQLQIPEVEQVKIKMPSQVQAPDANNRQVLTGTNNENQNNLVSPKKKLKPQKRKLYHVTGTNNQQLSKKSGTGFVLASPQINMVGSIVNPLSNPLTSASIIISPSAPTAMTNTVSSIISPIINPANNLLTSASILISPPAPTTLTNAVSSPLLSPSVVLPESTPSPTMPLVAVPFPQNSLPTGAQASVGATRIPLSILANHLMGIPQEKLGLFSSAVKESESSASRDDSSYNFTPAGNDPDYPFMMEIKDEVKEEPLTLGPDDPMEMEDDEDEDFGGWDNDEHSAEPEDAAPTNVSAETQTPLTYAAVVPNSLSVPVIKTKRVSVTEPSSGGPLRVSHVLPQILQKPSYGKTVFVKAKDSRNKVQLVQEQKSEELPFHIQSISKLQESPAVKDGTKVSPLNSPQKMLENIEMSPSNKVLTQVATAERSDSTSEAGDLNPCGENSQPGPSPGCITVRNFSETQSQQGFEDDAGLREMMEFIQEGEAVSDSLPTFFPINSDKKRNQPYLIRSSKIATKNEEPVKFCLKGVKASQTITISMRYTEEKFKHIPVKACRLHQKNNDRVNFQVSSVDENLVEYKEEQDNPTAHLVVSQPTVDAAGVPEFYFYVTFICLNSCHKGNGKKMELIFKLNDPSTDQLLKEKHFEVRVCKNVKRDYKEAMQAEQNQCLKVLVRPDSFLYPDEAILADNRNTVTAAVLAPGSEPLVVDSNLPSSEAITTVNSQASATDNPNHEFFLVRLPNSKRGKMVLDLVREFEKTIMDLEPGPLAQDPIENDRDPH